MPRMSSTSFIPFKNDNSKSEIHKYATKQKFIRGMSGKEKHSCKAIVAFIRKTFKELFYKSSLIGTPTLISVSKHGKQCLYDNLYVAREIALNTKNKFEILIGNSIDKEKSESKAKDWDDADLSPNYIVKLGPLDAKTFEREVKRLLRAVKNKPNEQILIVLLTGGQWSGLYNRWNLDLNYKKIVKRLTKKYPQFHFIGTAIRGYSMNAFYINNNKITYLTHVGSLDHIW